jgi:hypothetical protein
MAERTRSPGDRDMLLNMAKTWDDLATARVAQFARRERARGASQPVCCPRSSELRRGLRIACHLPFVPCDRLSKR